MFLHGHMGKAKEIFFHMFVWTSKNPEWTCITFVKGGGEFWKNFWFGLQATEMKIMIHERGSFTPSQFLWGACPKDVGSTSSPCAHVYLLSRNSVLATKCGTFQPKYLCIGKSFHLAFYGARKKESSFNIPLCHCLSRMAARNKYKILSFHPWKTTLWHEF